MSDSDRFPIIVRFGKQMSKYDNSRNYLKPRRSKKHVNYVYDFGYPFKIWITKNMNAMNIYNEFLSDEFKKKYNIRSCYLNNEKTKIKHIIFDSAANKKINQLIIVLAEVVSMKWTFDAERENVSKLNWNINKNTNTESNDDDDDVQDNEKANDNSTGWKWNSSFNFEPQQWTFQKSNDNQPDAKDKDQRLSFNWDD